MATWAAYAALTSFFRRISCRDGAEGSTDTADALFLFVDGFRNEPTSTDVGTPIEGVVLCSMRAGVEATDGSIQDRRWKNRRKSCTQVEHRLKTRLSAWFRAYIHNGNGLSLVGIL